MGKLLTGPIELWPNQPNFRLTAPQATHRNEVAKTEVI